MPNMTEVQSSNVKEIGKEGDDLLVRFKTSISQLYRYAGAAKHFDPMLAAPSPGGYFAKNVKNAFPSSKVKEE